MYNKQYLDQAREIYPDFDSRSQYWQQGILNKLHEELMRTDPEEAQRLRRQQYRINRHSQTEVLTQRVERTEKAYSELLKRIEYLEGDLEKVYGQVKRLKQSLQLPNLL